MLSRTDYSRRGLCKYSLAFKELDDQYDLLIKTEKDLKFKYRQAVSQLQVYQLTSTACGWFEEWCFGETFQEKRIEEEAAQKTEYDNELKQVEKLNQS